MILPEELERLRRTFPMVGKLAPAMGREIERDARDVRLPAGALLFDAHQPCSGLGLMLDGRVRVSAVGESGRELTLYRVRPGEVCVVTTSCLLGGTTYPARGVVEEALTALLVSRPVFLRLVAEAEPFRRFVLELYSSRVTQLMELVTEVAFNRLDRRLAAVLQRRGPEIAASHQELADELGSTREMVSRILESFADQGLVELGRRRVVVAEPAALAEFAGRG